MTVEVIRYAAGNSQALAGSVVRFEPAKLAAFLDEQAGPRGAVFVLPSDTLNKLVESSSGEDLLADRDKQNSGKGLTRYLLTARKPVALRVKYDTPGRLERGVQSVLVNFSDPKRKFAGPKLMFLGVPAGLFRKLERSLAAVASAMEDDAAVDFHDDVLAGVEVDPAIAEAFLGQSLEARIVRKLIQVAASDDRFDPVLLVGESGMGKSLAARLIHAHSSRRNGPLKEVNCAAIPSDLLELELFGSRTDVFGGSGKLGRASGDAAGDKIGYWQAAENGTLFLDEIGDLRLEHQAKVLVALETRRIRRVGRNQDIPVNARVIAASNQNLLESVAAGTFREDLLNRLQLLTIHFPSLRENPEDIRPLVQGLWAELCGADAIALPGEVVDAFVGWPWPGGVREIKNLLRQAYLLFQMARRSDPKYKLTLRYFEAIRAERAREEKPPGRSGVSHAIEALRWLARAESVLHACDAGLRAAFGRKLPGEDDQARTPTIVRAHLCEVAYVARSARGKVNERIVDHLDRFREALGDLDRDLATSWAAARGLWSAKGASVAARTSSAIREEILRLAGQL